LMQRIVFKRIGGKVQTNTFKGLMDFIFIVIEKIGSKFEAISSLYLELYRDVVTREIALSRLSKNENALVIGSGSLPATPALIAMASGAKVVSIDKDPSAVKAAIKYVHNHHLERHLTIVNADGLRFPLSSFDVIFVLYGVKQPEEMLAHIASQINEKTRVVLRVITDNRGVLADKTIDVGKLFIIKDRVRTQTLGSFESLLLIKKP
jgi:protein-L-isoaspartate O-methyltransferase